jgi:hypothetical protein
MSTMNHTPVSSKEVSTIKLLLSKGLRTDEICSITSRSHQTISRVACGKFDDKFCEKPERAVTQPANDELRELISKTLDSLARIEEFLKGADVK